MTRPEASSGGAGESSKDGGSIFSDPVGESHEFCGTGMAGFTHPSRGRTYRHYLCPGYMRGEENHPLVRAADVEGAIVSRLEELGRDPTFLEEGRRRLLLDRMRSGTQDAKRVGVLREVLRQAEARELEAFKSKADGLISPDQFSRIAGALEAERAEAVRELADAEARLLRTAEGGVDVGRVLQVLGQFRTVFAKLELHEQREVVRALVARVERIGGAWRVTLREPFASLLAEGVRQRSQRTEDDTRGVAGAG